MYPLKWGNKYALQADGKYFIIKYTNLDLMGGEIKMPMSKKEMQRQWAEKEAQMQNIIKNRDWNALFAVDENDDFSWTLEQILWSFVTNKEDGSFDISNLNHTQKVLFLVLELESATQADALPNFFEDFAIYGREAVQALEEVGASQCAVALNAVVDTLPNGIYPKGDKEFWDSIMSGKNSDIWDKADSVLMDYTDGWFPDLCRTYAEAHRDTVQVG